MMSLLTILLATYHGETFISHQIEAIAKQVDGPIDLHVSDDSKDAHTRDIIERVAHGQSSLTLHVGLGPQKGFAENFRSLILNTDPKSEYIAFCDQDDIWLPDKTKRSIEWLRKQPDDVPALYCGRTRIIDENDEDTGRMSPLFARPPSFKNALVQSIAGGNTMTMNRAAFDLMKRSLAHGTPVSHDWWAYIIISGSGGHVYYDPEPLTLYRQHGGNLIGENRSHAARAKRIRMIMMGKWREWQDTHLKLLDLNRDELTERSRKTLDMFKNVREPSPFVRLTSLRRSGVWRQSSLDLALLHVASLFNRI